MFIRFDVMHECDRQTDRQTLHHSKDRAYASHRAVKIILLFCSVLVPSIDRYRTNTVP